MKNNPKIFERWQCFSLESLKDTQFLIDINPHGLQPLKLYYFLSQPLIFGSGQKGVASFIVTDYELLDDLPEQSCSAITKCLDQLVVTKQIQSYRLKEIDSGSVRVSVIYSADEAEDFAVIMIQSFINILKGLNATNGTGYKSWFDQMKFVSESYHFHSGVWLTSRDYYSARTGLETNDFVDELQLYRANIKDLF